MRVRGLCCGVVVQLVVRVMEEEREKRREGEEGRGEMDAVFVMGRALSFFEIDPMSACIVLVALSSMLLRLLFFDRVRVRACFFLLFIIFPTGGFQKGRMFDAGVSVVW